MAKDLSYRRGFVRHFPFSGDCSCVIRENQLGEIFFADEMQSQQPLRSILVEKGSALLSLSQLQQMIQKWRRMEELPSFAVQYVGQCVCPTSVT